MSSTQDPNTPETPAPTESTGTDSTPSESTSSEPTTGESTPSQPNAPVTVSVEMMLFEAGMVANSLSSKALGSNLAQRLYDEEQAAEHDEKSSFEFAFSPFEAGMALDGMSRTVDGSLDDLKGRLSSALAAKMQELGVQPIGNPGGAVGGSSDGGNGSLGSSDGSLGEEEDGDL